MTIKQMREIKEKRGYSYAQLSEYTGVPAITLQKIFSGKTKSPRIATLNAIEKVLGGDEEKFQGKAFEYGKRSLYLEIPMELNMVILGKDRANLRLMIIMHCLMNRGLNSLTAFFMICQLPGLFIRTFPT